jgi:hypothetical protein
VRCRHCGATFSSARPESTREFHTRAGQKQRLPALCRGIIWLFIFSALPCTAPPAAVIGGVWYASNRQDIKTLPGIFAGLGVISLVLAIGQTALIVLFTVVYTLAQP